MDNDPDYDLRARLIRDLYNADYDTIVRAVQELSRRGFSRGIKRRLRFLRKHPSLTVRTAAVEALGKIKEQDDALAELTQLSQDMGLYDGFSDRVALMDWLFEVSPENTLPTPKGNGDE